MNDKEKAERIVKLIGQLVELAATPSDTAPKWKKGDRAFVEVEVTGVYGPGGKYVNLGVVGAKPNIAAPANLLQEIA